MVKPLDELLTELKKTKRRKSTSNTKKNPKGEIGVSATGKHIMENRQPLPPPLKGKGNAMSAVRAARSKMASYRNSTVRNQELDVLRQNLLARNPDGSFKMTNEEFKEKISKPLVKTLKQMRADGVIKGALMRLPKEGKTFVVGDTHEQVTNLLAAIHKADLDNNPLNRVVILGDVISGSKAAGSEIDYAAHGDASHRIISWLQARYPDQVVILNGNHEVGIMAGSRKMKFGGDKEMEKNARPGALLGKMEARVFSDTEDVNERIENLPLVIQIGDKKKGEKTRSFQHSPGFHKPENLDKNITIEQLETIETAQDMFDKGGSVSYGDGAPPTKESAERLNQQSGSDVVYHGHVSPNMAMDEVANNNLNPIEHRGAVMRFDGGLVFVDSQMDRSGIVEIDLDDDSAPEKIHLISDLKKEYQQSNNLTSAMATFGGSDEVIDDPEKLVKPMTPEQKQKSLDDLLNAYSDKN